MGLNSIETKFKRINCLANVSITPKSNTLNAFLYAAKGAGGLASSYIPQSAMITGCTGRSLAPFLVFSIVRNTSL